jgi:outer membrane lipoprotein-sorting protein
VEDMTGEQLEEMKRQAIGDETYLNPEKHGIVFVYKGQEKLEDTDHDVLLMTYADGTEVTMYLDSKTHLVYKTISIQPNAMTGVEAEVESYTTEYKEVDNMMAAFNITQYMDGEEYLVIMLEEVKFNTGLEDSLFIKQ